MRRTLRRCHVGCERGNQKRLDVGLSLRRGPPAASSSSPYKLFVAVEGWVPPRDGVGAENSVSLQISSFAKGDQGFWHSRGLGCGRLMR
jgi:hypothetical protein